MKKVIVEHSGRCCFVWIMYVYGYGTCLKLNIRIDWAYKASTKCTSYVFNLVAWEFLSWFRMQPERSCKIKMYLYGAELSKWPKKPEKTPYVCTVDPNFGMCSTEFTRSLYNCWGNGMRAILSPTNRKT